MSDAGSADRSGARQPERFDPARADRLDDPAREGWLPTARLIALLDVRAGMTVIDFGAGTGAVALPLARAHPGATIVALDEQPAMLERLRERAGAQMRGNLRTIAPSEIDAFRGRCERVLAVNVLHELGDAALAELVDLLAPDGFALVVDWSADVERSVGPPRDHVYRPEEAHARLERLGLQVTELVAEFPNHYALFAFKRGA
ncbi:MAG: class I SAM-dependent methyltransferase [Vulcanimicrobiaceae bacterium]